VSELVAGGKVRAAHDVSDGGLAVAVAEMCIASDLGATLEVTEGTYGYPAFGLVPTTYVLEMSERDATDCELPVIGSVDLEARLRLDAAGASGIDIGVAELAGAWRSPLAKGGGR
jgi:phosphoribosylformylglycinamidine synthase